MFISIIIPIYNENDILEKNILNIFNYFQNKSDFEIIVIDDGSTDNSIKTLNSLKLNNLIILRNNQNMGKGYSIIKGSKGTAIHYFEPVRKPIIEDGKIAKNKKGEDMYRMSFLFKTHYVFSAEQVQDKNKKPFTLPNMEIGSIVISQNKS